MKNLVLVIVLLVLSHFKPQEHDYSQLKNLYSDFVQALKSKDDAILKEFCHELTPGNTTLDFMRKNGLCYRGIPCELDEKGIPASAAANNIYPNILRFRDKLIRAGLINDLVHIDATEYESETMLINGVSIKGTEDPILFRSGNKMISYPIGEMFLIDNRWTLFTKPGSGYSVTE